MLKRADFRRVYSAGARFHGRHVVVFALPNPELRNDRLGVTASRKVGGAVERARCRRRMRELFRLYFRTEEQQLRDSLDVVMNARASCARAPWEELRRDLDRAMAALDRKLG